MKKDSIVVFISMEMLIPELLEPGRSANFKGGLGILSGDIMEGFAKTGIKGVGVIPFYHLHWLNREKIEYSLPAQFLFELRPEINGKRKSLKVWKVNRGGSEVFGLECPETFDVLYTDDRWQRLQQEVLLGKTAPVLLKKLEIKPDIFWLQEGHTAIILPTIKEDPYFNETKTLFTIHTSVPGGLEKFYEGWFDSLGIDRTKYYPIFAKAGLLDFTKAAMVLSDLANAVSQEHAQITKKMFPEFSQKILGIKNGSNRDFWLSPRLKELGENVNFPNLWEVHQEDKKELLGLIERKTGIKLDFQKPVISWVRRIVAYKNQYPMLDPSIKAILAERGELVDTPLGKLEGLGMQMIGAGRSPEGDAQCMGWVEEFKKWQSHPQLKGKFVFLAEYNLELIKIPAQGCDIWLHCPWPKWEACGTSDQRATINGNPVLTTKTGGAKEYIKEFNPETGEGNGFFIEPYKPETVYQKLKVISQLYYDWIEKRNDLWLKLRKNVFETGKSLDISDMIEKYQKLFEKLNLKN